MLILASASPRRRQLLQSLGLEFEVRPQNCAERSTAADPVDYVREIALQKAKSAQRTAGPDDIVLAADTVVHLNGENLGKPRDAKEARAMLRALSGATHLVCTGMVLLQGGRCTFHCERTEVTIYELSDRMIDWYVDTGEPLDKAGAYGIQGKGALLVRGIAGDFYNVMGLPVAPLVRMLRQFSCY